MRSPLLALACLATFASLAPAQTQCLSTLFARNNGGSNGGAVYFDVNVLNPNGISVTSLETNTLDLVAFTMDVYLTPGTRVGVETNPLAWTLVSSGPGVGAGADIPTPIDVVDFSLATGSYGVALVMSAAAGHDYTNGTGTNQFFANADLEISLGGASNTPFVAGIFQPRVWNGTICYHENVECYLMGGLVPTSFRLGNDHLALEPLFTIPMTLTNLPVINVPPSPGLQGISVYFQSMLYNPPVYPNDPLRLSAGLQYQIGVQTRGYGQASGLSMWPMGQTVAQPGGQIAIGFSIN